MQKQEIKSKRRSRELEGPASWREHRAMISHHDRRAARERQVNVVSRRYMSCNASLLALALLCYKLC